MFGCLGFPQYFSVPPSVTQITAIAEGAAGGDVSAAPAPGLGGTIAGTLSVTPGQLLSITVGCREGFGWAKGGSGGQGFGGGSSAGLGDHVGFTASDDRGGSCTGTVTVCVVHDQNDESCVDSGQAFDATRCP